ncbi:MAG: hypothetical protein DCC73_09915 [Proteobacteria bacterium]|nr:MAG: hypothetical protein DCC73_09915 [Pseudomonadota bacterium]
MSSVTELLQKNFEWQLENEPSRRTMLGLAGIHDQWEAIDEGSELRRVKRWQADLNDLNAMSAESWSSEDCLNADIFRHLANLRIDRQHFLDHESPVGLFGYNILVPFILTTYQPLRNAEDIECYVKRVQNVTRLFDELIGVIRVRERRGFTLPKSSYGPLIESCRGILRGQPFDDDSQQSGPLADACAKIQAMTIGEALKSRAMSNVAAALRDYLAPAYKRLIECLEDVQAKAREEHGVWRLPRGEDYYAYTLRYHAETGLSAEEIHIIGRNEVIEVQEEIRKVAENLGETLSLSQFFETLRSTDKYHYPSGADGRNQMMTDARAILERVDSRLPHYFTFLPKARVELEPIPSHMEETSPIALYRPGTWDGSTPGAYLLNLRDPSAMPRYLMEALAVHEAIPGHHLQLALVNELEHLPGFRRHQDMLTAYTEGWALYAERLADDMGIYGTPMARLGYLVMWLWRSARLVVDTGIHALRWSRDDAIGYFLQNTPLRRQQIEAEVDRYIQWPGQAVAYRLGCRSILELRATAERRLGAKFDLADFHAVVLGSGQVPLLSLRKQVDTWTKLKGAMICIM